MLLNITCQALRAGQGTIIPATEDLMEAALILHTEEADRLEAALGGLNRKVGPAASAAGGADSSSATCL